MTSRLQSGVDRHLSLAQQATMTAMSLNSLTGGES
jgi:hypothetical protein